MSIYHADVIDYVVTKKSPSEVVMVVTDHLEWGENDDEHLLLLQNKVNTYLQFYEGGDLFEEYPDAVSRKVKIEIRGKYPMNSKGTWFFEQMVPIVEEQGLAMKFEVATKESEESV